MAEEGEYKVKYLDGGEEEEELVSRCFSLVDLLPASRWGDFFFFFFVSSLRNG